MTQNWTKYNYYKIEDDQIFKKLYTKDIVYGYVYIEKIS